MNRAEHLAWCKQRALEYVEDGDLQGAVTSMGSDIRKHPETADHPASMLGMMLITNGHLDTQAKMRDWINGFS